VHEWIFFYFSKKKSRMRTENSFLFSAQFFWKEANSKIISRKQKTVTCLVTTIVQKFKELVRGSSLSFPAHGQNF
jgi:hypothetical protein